MIQIVEADQLDPDDVVDLALGNLDISQLTERLQSQRAEIEKIVLSNEASDVIRGAIAEFIETARVRMILASPEAIETVERVMRGQVDAKKGMAVVRAAETILDRGAFPKLTRVDNNPLPDKPRKALPPLEDLLEAEDDPRQRHKIVDNYLDVIRRVDEMRNGRAFVVEGQATETNVDDGDTLQIKEPPESD